MNKKMGRIPILINLTLLINGCIQQPDIPPNTGEFLVITETECIMGVHIDFRSGIQVFNETGVELVFTKFIKYAQDNQQPIFGDAYGNNWKFKNSTIHGIYLDVKYWKVAALWYSKEDKTWHIKTVFDVSETGEVVRLLGCV